MPPITLDLSTDSHVHTFLCNHAVGEMEDYVRAALAKGLRTLIFLEHLEAGINNRERTWLDEQAFDLYITEGERLQKAYTGQITIQLGVETGYNRKEAPALHKGLARYNWDRIGLSCHFYPYQGGYLNMLSRNPASLKQLAAIGSDQVLSEYFDTLLEGVETIPCHTVCHLDAALRHLPGLRFTESHRQQITRLLDAMRAKNISLELNTSGYVYRGHPFPAPWIVGQALARDMAFTIGSDAHDPRDVGRYFDRLPAYVERAVDQPFPEL